jgi:hypothetical protein
MACILYCSDYVAAETGDKYAEADFGVGGVSIISAKSVGHEGSLSN